MIELQTDGAGCWAIPYRFRRRRKAFRIVDGAIVEEPTGNQKFQHVPKVVPAFLEMTADGTRPLTHREIRSREVEARFYGLAGIFLLSTGDIAAVYRAKAETIQSAG